MKQRILIVTNISGWILGEIARQIVSLYGDDYDLYYISELTLRARPDLVQYLLTQVDIVQAMNQSATQKLLNLIGSDGPPIVTWIHHIAKMSAAIHNALVRSNLIIASTRKWADKIRSLAGCNLKIQVVNYGVDASFFRRTPHRRSHFGLTDKSFVIAFVASKLSDEDNERKGVDTLTSVVALLKEDLPNLHIVFIGAGWDDEVTTIRSLGLSANSIGFVKKKHLPELYSSVDLYLMTSRVEGGPCTVLEAMSCEVPVVATRVGLVSDVIIDGVNGYSADLDDTDRIAASILRVASSPDLARELGKNARKAIEDMSWRQTLSALKTPYAVLAAHSPRRLSKVPLAFAPNDLLRAVMASDALVWPIALTVRRQVSLHAGLQMLRALCDGLSVSDLMRGLRLVAGRTFRPPRQINKPVVRKP